MLIIPEGREGSSEQKAQRASKDPVFRRQEILPGGHSKGGLSPAVAVGLGLLWGAAWGWRGRWSGLGLASSVRPLLRCGPGCALQGLPRALQPVCPPQALYASKIISYTQGFMLLRQAAAEFGWSLNYGGIALMWRGGCIIRR